MSTGIKYTGSGVGLAWGALCKNIESQVDIFKTQARLMADDTKAAMDYAKASATDQENALIEQANGMKAQAWGNIAGSLVSGVTAGIALGKQYSNEATANKTEGEEYNGLRAGLEQKGAKPVNENNDGADIEMEDLGNNKNNNNLNNDNNNDGVNLDLSKNGAAKGVNSKEESVADRRKKFNKEQKGKAGVYRQAADRWRTAGNIVPQMTNSLLQSAGSMRNADYTNSQAEATRKSTIENATQDLLKTSISMNQTMQNTADGSMQGTLQAFSSIIGANVVRG